MTFDEFETLVRQLHAQQQEQTAYLDALPRQVSEFIATNALSESMCRQIALLSASAFGPALWPDVQWFLEEWRPGFSIEVRVATPERTSYTIDTFDDYLAYAKAELF